MATTRTLRTAAVAAVVLLAAAGSAEAGPPGKWSQVTGVGQDDGNPMRPGLARTADGVLHVSWSRDAGGRREPAAQRHLRRREDSLRASVGLRQRPRRGQLSLRPRCGSGRHPARVLRRHQRVRQRVGHGHLGQRWRELDGWWRSVEERRSRARMSTRPAASARPSARTAPSTRSGATRAPTEPATTSVSTRTPPTASCPAACSRIPSSAWTRPAARWSRPGTRSMTTGPWWSCPSPRPAARCRSPTRPATRSTRWASPAASALRECSWATTAEPTSSCRTPRSTALTPVRRSG